MWARRSGIHVALAAYLAFAVPHVLYHATNPAPDLSGAEQALNVIRVVSGSKFVLVD